MNKYSIYYKGFIDVIILHLLTTNESLYGYQIRKLINDITKEEINLTEGALYPCLHRLKKEELQNHIV